MERMEMSAGRVALPPFDTNELLKLIKQLVMIEKRWIPTVKGHSLYVRPTIIGTRDCKWPPSFYLALAMSNRADRKSTRLNSSHSGESRMPSSA